MKSRRRLGWLAALVVVAALSVYGFTRIRGAAASEVLPTAQVRKGDFLVIVRCRGELKARTSVQVVAPVNVPELRMVWLAPQGSRVKEGDPVVRFDPSSAKQEERLKIAALNQAQAALDQATAQAGITTEQDKLDLATAEYQVERAKLEVSKQEIVSRLQAEDSKVDLGLAEKKLSIQQANVQLNAAADRAKVASLARARDKAKDELELTQYRLSQMELTAPITGVINFMPNYSQGWMNAKPFKVGDQAWPGGVLAEIPDLQTLEMEGKVEEIDRGKISIGQPILVHIDSLPELTIPANLQQLSPMTVMGWEWPPTRTFRAFAKLQQVDARLRPSMNGQMDVVVNKIVDATSVPSKAVFTHAGKPVVYVALGGGFQSREVEILARNPDEVALKGIPAGSNVALAEPGGGKR
ncbi:MAG: efflux RND transporter periplasmic adaptor subunit [Bryobacteraceae bacterium]